MFRRLDESTIRTGERISTRLGFVVAILENGDRAIVQMLSIKFGNQPSNLCEYCFIDKSAIRLSERRSTRLELVLLES